MKERKYKHTHKTEGIPIALGAMANDSPRYRNSFLLLLLLCMCVFVLVVVVAFMYIFLGVVFVAYMGFCHVDVYCWVCVCSVSSSFPKYLGTLVA